MESHTVFLTVVGGPFQPLAFERVFDPPASVSVGHRGRIDFWSVGSAAAHAISRHTQRGYSTPARLRQNNFQRLRTATLFGRIAKVVAA